MKQWTSLIWSMNKTTTILVGFIWIRSYPLCLWAKIIPYKLTFLSKSVGKHLRLSKLPLITSRISIWLKVRKIKCHFPPMFLLFPAKFLDLPAELLKNMTIFAHFSLNLPSNLWIWYIEPVKMLFQSLSSIKDVIMLETP